MKKVVNSLILLLAALTPLSSAADRFTVDGLCYVTNGDGISVYVTCQNSNHNPSYTSLSGALNIPATVTYKEKTYSVTSIDRLAFCRCSGLTSVTIGNSVTIIGDQAFLD